MPNALPVTITDIQDTYVMVTTPDGQSLKLPLTAIIGKPALDQPLFIIAATTQNDTSAPHPLAQAIVEHLLEPSP